MGKLKSLLAASINWFTRKGAKRNRALRDILDLQSSIEAFLAKYHLQENATDFSLVFKNIGQARIDATEIAYLTGTRIRITRHIEDKDLAPLIQAMHDDLDDFKRALFTRSLGSVVLGERVLKLHKSLESLLTTVSEIEYR